MPVTSDDSELRDAKRSLRKAAMTARAAAAEADAAREIRAAWSLCDRFLEAVRIAPGSRVSAYWPMGDELDPRPLMEALHRRGHPLALPSIRAAAQPLDFRDWRPGEALVPAGFGTQEPAASAPVVQPEVLLVPLLAFDAAGYRLGYGGGFYDRSLALLRQSGDILAVGVAFAAQQVPSVPRDALDQRLDLVVTERGVLVPETAPA